ncbi:MAG: hypothetical protein ACI361_04530, partial [Atopobiaceae bacterium]
VRRRQEFLRLCWRSPVISPDFQHRQAWRSFCSDVLAESMAAGKFIHCCLLRVIMLDDMAQGSYELASCSASCFAAAHVFHDLVEESAVQDRADECGSAYLPAWQ